MCSHNPNSHHSVFEQPKASLPPPRACIFWHLFVLRTKSILSANILLSFELGCCRCVFGFQNFEIWCWVMIKINRIPIDIIFIHEITTSYFWQHHILFSFFELWIFFCYYSFFICLMMGPVMLQKYLLLLMGSISTPFDDFYFHQDLWGSLLFVLHVYIYFLYRQGYPACVWGLVLLGRDFFLGGFICQFYY